MTSKAVSEQDLALTEVSHRSPLAPWKLLVKAIGFFYRREDESCRAMLTAIHPESVPGRLVPAFLTMLGDSKEAPHLSPSARNLISEVLSKLADARSSLVKLDKIFSSDYEEDILHQIRATLKVCEREVPHFVTRLRQHISVKCLSEDIEADEAAAAMGKEVLKDAYLMRLFARVTETMSGDPGKIAFSCNGWHEFLQLAVSEKWFAEESVEAAAVYLHIAALLGRIPPKQMKKIQRDNNTAKMAAGADLAFIYPEKLYQRAMEADPHSDGFAAWYAWARTQPQPAADKAAKEWRKALPSDLQPVLKLLRSADKRGSYKVALDYLAEAEQIDSVHPEVRRARVKLLTAAIVRHLRQAKPHLAEAKIAELAEVSSMRQGDAPAFISALRYMAYHLRGDKKTKDELSEMQRILGSRLAAQLLVLAIARTAGIDSPDEPPSVEDLDSRDSADLLQAMGKVAVLANASGIKEYAQPLDYLIETTKRLERGERSLDAIQLRTLGNAALSNGQEELAYAASAAGLDLGAGVEAGFLIMRAQSLPPRLWQRQVVLAGAAVELGRKHREVKSVDAAVDFLHKAGHDDFPLPPEKLAAVLDKEKHAQKFPVGGASSPDYGEFFQELCNCPGCRAARGETGDSYDEDESDPQLNMDELQERILDTLPPDVPRSFAKMLLDAAKEAAKSGESPEAMFKSMFGPPPKKKKKGWMPW